MRRSTAGFTLVEVVVTIVVSSLVCIAATTLLITGLKTNRLLTDSSRKQFAVSAIEEALEKISDRSDITVSRDEEDAEDEDEGGNVVLLGGKEYIAFSGGQILLNGTSVLKDVTDCKIELKGHLLTVSFKVLQGVNEKPYDLAVYCPNSKGGP